MRREAVAVAFSGGKDSAAAAVLLREQGHEVRALTMRLGLAGEDEKLARIEALARVLGVPWRVVDFRDAFKVNVLDYFIAAYRRGVTPNPCVQCNRHLKFGLLLTAMRGISPEGLLATGHYADKIRIGDRCFLREPVDRDKSQVYFLAMIDPTALERIVFPLAGSTVEQVRKKTAGLLLANERDSQDVCFLQDERLAEFLGRHLPDAFQPGDVLNTAGEKIAGHRGALHFTVGQRRGTRHASGRRLYVIGRNLAANTVTLGEEQDLLSETMAVASPVFWRPLKGGETLSVKVRYERNGHEAQISELTASRIRAVFKRPVRAVTPGQFAVFYDGDIIVAAGEIAGA